MLSDGRCSVRYLIFGASLRADSLNGRLASLATRVVTDKGGIADLAAMSDLDCPSYDFDVERDEGVPTGARELCRRLKAADAVIIASPEYNASMPGVLKNAIDWVSRIKPQPFNGRQAMLLSASPSMTGGNRGLWALRIPLEHLGTRVYPDMYSLAQAHQAFDASGHIADATLRTRFESTIECFMDLVEAAKHYPGLKKQWIEFLGERTDATTERVESNPVDAEVPVEAR
jgi:chromate reductase, NAD(P)H dehydrogenase (quinone)